jgi:hypothetical protein
MALANVLALSSWHASLFDHDEMAVAPTPVAGGDHHHRYGAKHDEALGSSNEAPGAPTMDLRALTHAAIHGVVGLISNLAIPIALSRETMWYADRSFALCGIAPRKLAETRSILT